LLAASMRGVDMNGFVKDIEGLAVRNDEFRQVLYTAEHCQLVVMALKAGEEIGLESTISTSSFASSRGPVRRSWMAFGRRSAPASRWSSRPGRITTSSTPAAPP
jgi:hypothetical protein